VKRKLLNFKSNHVYENWLKKYVAFFLSSGHSTHNSNIVLDFLVGISDNYAPTTLWQAFSCLSKYFLVCLGISLDDNLLIKDFLKKQSKTHLPKKSLTFSKEDIENFLQQSSDVVMKCAIVVGLFGLSRIGELCNILFEDIAVHNSDFEFMISQSKTDQAKKGFTFRVVAPFSVHVQTYYDLFPLPMRTGRFFRKFVKGKPSRAVLGKNTISKFPSEVALFLGLSDPELYTGHCLRRTGATLLAESGVSKLTLKLAGRWKSDTSAMVIGSTSVFLPPN
jgi:integrase